MPSATDRQWQRWGAQNPYFGIVGIETKEFETRWRDRFFETGRVHMDHVFAQLERYDAAPAGAAKALDFGCGAGRLLLQMAGRFDAVVGVDVSTDQLDLARKNLRPDGLRLLTSLDDLGGEASTFDFVNTFVVLQHIRPDQGYQIIDRLLKLLKPGGSFAIHFTVGDTRDRRRKINWFRYRIPPLHWAYNLSRRRPMNEPIMEMNKYDFSRVGMIFMRNDVGRFGTSLFNHTDHTGMLTFGRREPGIGVLPQAMEDETVPKA